MHSVTFQIPFIARAEGWLKPGDQNLLWVSHVGSRNPSTRAMICLPGCISRKLHGKQSALDSGILVMGCRYPKGNLTYEPGGHCRGFHFDKGEGSQSRPEVYYLDINAMSNFFHFKPLPLEEQSNRAARSSIRN